MPQKYSKPVYPHDVPWWTYDIVIVIGLLASAWLGVRVHALFWIPFAVLVYGSFIEPRLLTVKRYTVGSGPKKLKAVYLSDLHVGPYKKRAWLRRLVRRVNMFQPDLVLLGGDYLYASGREAVHLEPLKKLRAKYGTYAILGNHDTRYGPGESEGALEKAGVHVLRNASVRIEHGGKAMHIVGVDDDWYAETEFEDALQEVKGGEPVIMLIHNPDLAPHAARFLSEKNFIPGQGRGASFMLSGHAHGGQIRLPFIGPVPPLPHHLGRKYDRGFFMVPGTKVPGTSVPLILGQGVGESGPRARLFCPPQIVLVELRI